MRLCENSHVAARGPLYFWSYAFYAAASAIESSHPKAKCKPAASEASKYYELLDTFLAVLNGSRQVVLAVSSALTRLFNMIVDSNIYYVHIYLDSCCRYSPVLVLHFFVFFPVGSWHGNFNAWGALCLFGSGGIRMSGRGVRTSYLSFSLVLATFGMSDLLIFH